MGSNQTISMYVLDLLVILKLYLKIWLDIPKSYSSAGGLQLCNWNKVHCILLFHSVRIWTFSVYQHTFEGLIQDGPTYISDLSNVNLFPMIRQYNDECVIRLFFFHFWIVWGGYHIQHRWMADLARIFNLRIPDCDYDLVYRGAPQHVSVQSVCGEPSPVPPAVWCLLPGLVYIPTCSSYSQYAILCPVEEKNNAL